MKGKRMSKKKPTGKNTLTADTVELNDTQLFTLGAIVDDWNAQEPADPPIWNANNVTAALIAKYLDVMEPDYAKEKRKPDFEAPKAP
jgi:hypothetical protein